jgi:hypothetical protein
MKRRNSNFSFAFKITLLSLLIILGRMWQRNSSQYFYNKIDTIQVKSDTNNAPLDNKYVFLRNVTWQVSK